MEAYKSRETTLRDYLRILFRYKILVLTTMAVVFLTVFIRMQIATPYAVATVKMMIVGKGTAETNFYEQLQTGIRTLVNTHSVLIKSNMVLERVVRALRLDQRPLDYEKKYSSPLKALLIESSVGNLKRALEEMTPEQRQNMLFKMAVDRLKGNIDATPILDTDMFEIKVKDVDPTAAALIANSVSRSLIIFDLEQQVTALQLKYGKRHTTVIQLKDYIRELYKTLDGRPLPDIEAIGPGSIKIVEQARAGEPGGGRGLISNIAVLFMSVFFGVFVAFVFDYLDQTFKTPQDIEKFLNIPLLGSIPKKKYGDELLIKDTNPITSDYARSYQTLSDQIYLLMKDRNLQSLLITSAECSGDHPVVVANLGLYFAHRGGNKVLLIDADLRYPSLSRLFDITNNTGLSDVLENKVSMDDAVQDLGHGLHVLPSGESNLNPVIFFNSSAMADIIKKARESYEFIFMNCADLKNFTDAVPLSFITDGTVFVINQGKVRRQVVKTALAPLEQKNANIIGAVLNNRTYVIPGIIYKLA
ncbi:MAG: polysaccharide biosynthesis tyrosine autokinase [Deferribacteres bacterium]|nr:polysaccharide biosynthesis tyrosine autokinase [Deferribacteres bacterium]